jgi:hypothetical protein
MRSGHADNAAKISVSDDLGFGMLLEPIRCSRRGAIRQYVDYLSPFQPCVPPPCLQPQHNRKACRCRRVRVYSLIETLTDVVPQSCSRAGEIADHPANRIDELLPWRWKANQ